MKKPLAFFFAIMASSLFAVGIGDSIRDCEAVWGAPTNPSEAVSRNGKKPSVFDEADAKHRSSKQREIERNYKWGGRTMGATFCEGRCVYITINIKEGQKATEEFLNSQSKSPWKMDYSEPYKRVTEDGKLVAYFNGDNVKVYDAAWKKSKTKPGTI